MDPFELAFDRAFGAGVCSVQFFDFARAAGVMVEAAQGGDAAALRMLDVVGGFLDRVAATHRREAATLCIACPAAFFGARRRPAVILVIGAQQIGAAALTAGACRQCAEAAGWPGPGWQQRLSAKIWPNARLALTSSAVGTA